MYNIGAPEYKTTLLYNDGINSDIIKTINSNFAKAVEQARPFAKQFDAGNSEGTARNIWNYLRNQIQYIKDPAGRQFIRMPRRLAADKFGDCKSYSVFTAGVLGALGYPVFYRYASYDKNDKTPTHIYAYTKDKNGKTIIIDGVYSQFNEEAPYTYKIDNEMKIAVLSGTPQMTKTQGPKISLENLLHKVKPGGFYFHVITNQINASQGKSAGIRYNSQQLEQYKRRLINHITQLGTKRGAIYQLLQKELSDVQTGRFSGSIAPVTKAGSIAGLQDEIGKLRLKKLSLKKIGKGIKKATKAISLKNVLKGIKAVGLAPMRKAILLMVNLNMLGLASRMAKLPPNELKSWWEKRGGSYSAIRSAVNRGRGKRPVFRGRQVRAVHGIGYVVDSYTIGEGAADAAAGPKIDFNQILQVAAPLLKALLSLFSKHNIPEETGGEGTRSDSETLADLTKLGGEGENSFNSYADAAVKIAQDSGILPEPPQTAAQSNLNSIIPGDDLGGNDPVTDAERETAGASSNEMLLLALGLGVAYVVTN
jgi:hypothetical protein